MALKFIDKKIYVLERVEYVLRLLRLRLAMTSKKFRFTIHEVRFTSHQSAFLYIPIMSSRVAWRGLLASFLLSCMIS